MKKETYEKPAIVFESNITTRAGSGGGHCGKKPCGGKIVDPADLFD